MNDKGLTFELIEKYFEGTATPEEIELYNYRLKNETIFAQDVADYQKLRNGFDVFKDRLELKSKLNQFHDEMPKDTIKQTPQTKIIPWYQNWTPIMAAASLAFVIGTFAFIGMKSNQTKSHYQALKLDLEKVKKSQSKLWQVVSEEDEKAEEMLSGGTGFAISNNMILTDYHVIKDANKIFAENDKFGSIKTKLIYSNEKLDFAILAIEDSSNEGFGNIPFKFETNQAPLGQKVYTLGYPQKSIVYGEGYVSSANGYEDDTLAYQIGIWVNPGNSGGALFNEQGNVIGVITAKNTENEGAVYALKSKEIIEAIHKSEVKIKLTNKSKTNKNYKLSKIENAKQFVFRIKTSR